MENFRKYTRLKYVPLHESDSTSPNRDSTNYAPTNTAPQNIRFTLPKQIRIREGDCTTLEGAI